VPAYPGCPGREAVKPGVCLSLGDIREADRVKDGCEVGVCVVAGVETQLLRCRSEPADKSTAILRDAARQRGHCQSAESSASVPAAAAAARGRRRRR